MISFCQMVHDATRICEFTWNFRKAIKVLRCLLLFCSAGQGQIAEEYMGHRGGDVRSRAVRLLCRLHRRAHQGLPVRRVLASGQRERPSLSRSAHRCVTRSMPAATHINSCFCSCFGSCLFVNGFNFALNDAGLVTRLAHNTQLLSVLWPRATFRWCTELILCHKADFGPAVAACFQLASTAHTMLLFSVLFMFPTYAHGV